MEKRIHFRPQKPIYSFKAEEDWGDYVNGKRRVVKRNKDGYAVHRYLCEDGISHKIGEHVAKWEYFNGEIPDGMVIDHIIPVNSGGTNKLSNLRLVTPEGNANNEITKRNLSKALKGMVHSEEWNKKISEGNKGKKMSDEAKKKMSEIKKEWLKDPKNHPMYGRKGKDNPLYGRKTPIETRKKMSASMKGKRKGIPNSKLMIEVYQCTLDGELVKVWNKMGECKDDGFAPSAICRCCKKKFNREGNNIYKGFKWMYKSDYEKMLAEQGC